MTKTATVYRVEHKVSGQGPYQRRNLGPLAAMDRAHSGFRHPCPWEDLGLSIQFDMFCGFASPWALMEWFGGWIPALHKAGFRLAVYRNVKVVGKSEKTGQVVFYRNDTKKLCRLPQDLS